MPAKGPTSLGLNRPGSRRPITPRKLPPLARRDVKMPRDLNFKVDPDFHFAFKVVATRRKMPMKDFLDACFRCWVDLHGSQEEKALLPPQQ